MNLSGIAVSVRPQSFDHTIELLDALQGVEVHFQDSATARAVLVQEADSVDAEVEGLKRIKAVPGVVVAELVYHYFADDQDMDKQTPLEFDAANGISESVLQRLNPN